MNHHISQHLRPANGGTDASHQHDGFSFHLLRKEGGEAWPGGAGVAGISIRSLRASSRAKCVKCNGTGYTMAGRCDWCGGTGTSLV